MKIGDAVEVHDDGLAMLQKFFPYKPNNLGWVHEVWDDGTILVEFPIGDDDPDEHSQIAPYPPNKVALREDLPRRK